MQIETEEVEAEAEEDILGGRGSRSRLMDTDLDSAIDVRCMLTIGNKCVSITNVIVIQSERTTKLIGAVIQRKLRACSVHHRALHRMRWRIPNNVIVTILQMPILSQTRCRMQTILRGMTIHGPIISLMFRCHLTGFFSAHQLQYFFDLASTY